MFGEKCNVTATIRFWDLLLNGLWKRAENFKNIIAFWCARARITAHLSRRTRHDLPFSWKMIFNTNSFIRQTSNLNHSCQGVLYTNIARNSNKRLRGQSQNQNTKYLFELVEFRSSTYSSYYLWFWCSDCCESEPTKINMDIRGNPKKAFSVAIL